MKAPKWAASSARIGTTRYVYSRWMFWHCAGGVKDSDDEYIDPVIEVYVRDVDRTLLRENLKLTPAQRLEKFVRFSRFVAELRKAGERSREEPGDKAPDER